MKWIEINNPPEYTNDTLLWKGKLGRQDTMLRAFYACRKDGTKCWMNENGRKLHTLARYTTSCI